MKHCIILGTRPEIIKMYPIIKRLEEKGKDYFIIHTNQHYSENMDRIFFNELNLPAPKHNLNIGSGTHGKQTGLMLQRIEEILIKEKPDVVMVEGDTNTVLAGALAATKLHIKVAHVEAGLRSYDTIMPEEINRKLTDHISHYLFAPTEIQKKILLSENLSEEQIFVVGNTIVDSVKEISKLAMKKSNILKKLKLEKNQYFLVTAHREENVDVRERFKGIIDGLNLLSEEFGMKIIYPIHPRSRKMLNSFNIPLNKNVILIDPVGYLDMLQLLKNSKLVLTDSGGLQEESCLLKVPCVTLRDNTERPETLDVGSNILAGTKPEKILEMSKFMVQKKKNWRNPFGDGTTGTRILNILENNLNGR